MVEKCTEFNFVLEAAFSNNLRQKLCVIVIAGPRLLHAVSGWRFSDILSRSSTVSDSIEHQLGGSKFGDNRGVAAVKCSVEAKTMIVPRDRDR